MTDPIDATRRLINLLDAITDSPTRVTTSLHDFGDGTLIKTLRSWATARGFEVKRTTLTGDIGGEHVTWDQFRFTAENGSEVCVHDMASRRAAVQAANDDQMWSPAQAVAS